MADLRSHFFKGKIKSPKIQGMTFESKVKVMKNLKKKISRFFSVINLVFEEILHKDI